MVVMIGHMVVFNEKTTTAAKFKSLSQLGRVNINSTPVVITKDPLPLSLSNPPALPVYEIVTAASCAAFSRMMATADPAIIVVMMVTEDFLMVVSSATAL